MNRGTQMHRRFIVLSAVAVGALARTTAAQPRVQFDFDAEFRRARAIGSELQSDLARLGLVLFSQSLTAVRQAEAPRGYERQPDFQRATLRLREVLQTTLLQPGPIPNPLPVSGDVEAFMRNRYQQNALGGELADFLTRIRRPSPTLSALSDAQILRYQLSIAVLIASRNTDAWDQISRATGIYPFC